MKKTILSLLLALLLLLTLAPLAGAAEEMEIVKTDVTADSVGNTGGYANVRINAVYNQVYVEEYDQYYNAELLSMRQAGLMDRTGKMVFPYKETWLSYSVDGGVVSLVGSSPYDSYFLNENWVESDPVEVPEQDPSGGDNIGMTGNGHWEVEDDPAGFFRLDGTPILTGFWGASPMSGGYAFVVEYGADSELGAYIINSEGQKVFSFDGPFLEMIGYGGSDYSSSFGAFAKASWFRDGLLLTWTYERNDYYFNPGIDVVEYVNSAGQVELSIPGDRYGDYWPFAEGMAAVKSNSGLFGFIDKTGTEVIPCIYEDVGTVFSDGLTYARRDGKWGYIDKTGAEVIPFEYDACYGAGSGLAAVVRDGKCGLVDYQNRVVVPLEYDDISSYTGGVAYAIKDGYVYIITPKQTEKPSGWAEKEVSAAVEAGLVPAELQKGYTNPVSRGAVAQMFVNLLEASSGRTIDEIISEKGAAINPDAFTDTTDKAVLACNALGIINGVGGGRFDPEGTLTRAQIAAIINRVARVMGVATEGYTHSFTDVSGSWVDGELGWPVHAGIINGVGDNKFNPSGQLTTEQAIAITNRALNALK